MPNWNQVLTEIRKLATEHDAASKAAVDLVRRKYLKQLHQATGRNIIAYYSGFLSKPGILQSGIEDEDKNGFMMAVHQLDRTKGLDLILHTPGGSIGATESLVDYLRQMFSDDIRAIVPQIAMSAGTMIACSCKCIVLATHSNLGPIDPQMNGMPAAGVLEEFSRACREVKKDSSRTAIWQAIIGQYSPTFLSQCENAISWSKDFVTTQLQEVMFKGRVDGQKQARKVVRALTDYRGNKAHNRHINRDECIAIGLNVETLEADAKFQDLVLTVHHCYMHSLMNTASFKMIENHLGAAFVKQQQVVVQAVQS